MMKLVYHVAILDLATNQLEYVTDTNLTVEYGKAAIKVPRQIADGMMYDLIRMGQPAVIIKAPDQYELSN